MRLVSDNANDTAASNNEPPQDAKPAPAAEAHTPAPAAAEKKPAAEPTVTYVKRTYGERLASFLFDKRS